MKQVALAIPLTALLVVAILFAVGNYTTYSLGSMTFRPAQTVTVTGTSREQQANNEASFSVGVNEYDSDRDAAVALVNETINGIIADLKEFGIPEGDIKTESVSFSRLDDPYRPDVNGQWSANSNITVILRDASRVNELSTLLSASGATNVYGPNFRVAEGSQSEEQLLQSAIENAREKAEAIASGSQVQLGKVISVDETMSGGGFVPMFDSRGYGGGGGPAIEAGTTTVSKSVQVTFELK
jgi:uncharacterized protein YggE